jgi:hydrogenase nickel incorporation protein HypA/HybF
LWKERGINHVENADYCGDCWLDSADDWAESIRYSTLYADTVYVATGERMHELAIAQSIVEVVMTRARECGATHVKLVRLQIGEASGIMTDSLAFSFEMLTSLDPLLDGTQLLIESIPHVARCGACAQEFAIVNLVPLCPICQQWSGDVISGTELQIQEMEIETALSVMEE